MTSSGKVIVVLLVMVSVFLQLLTRNSRFLLEFAIIQQPIQQSVNNTIAGNNVTSEASPAEPTTLPRTTASSITAPPTVVLATDTEEAVYTTTQQQQQTTERRILPTELQRRLNRTAILWPTVGLTTECEAARLRHLVETCGPGMDVWILTAHHILKARHKEADVNRSKALIAAIPGLHQAPQHTSAIRLFDGNSGSSKSSFLRFLNDHPEYDYAWHVETDMFFTGPWEDLFLPEMLTDNTTDFLSSTVNDKSTGREWYWVQGGKCKVFGKICRSIVPLQTGWMFARVSSKLANSLLQDALKGHIKGHHEAVVGPYSVLNNFTYGPIDMSKVHKIVFGHKRGQNVSKMDVSWMKPPMGTLMHPVKCDAYYDADHDKNWHPSYKTMESDLEKWASSKQ